MNLETFTNKDFAFLYNLSKGKLIEVAIEKLLLKIGAEVKRIGIEHIGQGFLDDLKNENSNVATNLRLLPDFLVRFSNQQVKFIEVKYRADGHILLMDLVKYIEGIDFIIASDNELFYLTSGDIDSLHKEFDNLSHTKIIELKTPINLCNFLSKDQDAVKLQKAVEEIKSYIKWLMPKIPKSWSSVPPLAIVNTR